MNRRNVSRLSARSKGISGGLSGLAAVTRTSLLDTALAKEAKRYAERADTVFRDTLFAEWRVAEHVSQLLRSTTSAFELSVFQKRRELHERLESASRPTATCPLGLLYWEALRHRPVVVVDKAELAQSSSMQFNRERQLAKAHRVAMQYSTPTPLSFR